MRIRTILAVLFAFPFIGCLLMGWGWFDYEDSRTASPEVNPVELADLEKGTPVGNNHVRLGEHLACYEFTVYTYNKSKYSTSKPTDDTSISECFYPVISTTSKVGKEIVKLEKEYGSLDKVPDDEKIELPEQFAVVVKTYRYKKVGDIPSITFQKESQAEGLLLNKARLKYDEKKLLKESFPRLDTDKLLVLEEGRQPSSSLWCFTRIGAGVVTMMLGPLIALIGVVMLIRGK